MEGDQMKMREALEMARDALKSAEKYVYDDPPNGGAIGWDDVWPSEWHNALEAVERALSARPRNCDVGTAEEQAERMRLYCKSHGEDESGCFRCEKCPFLTDKRCELAWAQMPYEAEEGEGE